MARRIVVGLLVEAAYRSRKAELLSAANRKLEMLRWLVRLAWDRNLLSGKQYEFCCRGLTEYGRMVGGWLKQATDKEARQLCVDRFVDWLVYGDQSEVWFDDGREKWERMRAELATLAGRELFCYCPLDEPCHADVLAHFAGRSPPFNGNNGD